MGLMVRRRIGPRSRFRAGRGAAEPLWAGAAAGPRWRGGPGPGGAATRLPVLRDPQGGHRRRVVAEAHPGERLPRPTPPATGRWRSSRWRNPRTSRCTRPWWSRTRCPTPTPSTRLSPGVRREDVRDVLMRLPESLPGALVLRYMDGFTTKEIAQMLDTPLGTVLARLHRGRKRFERECGPTRRRPGSSSRGWSDDRGRSIIPCSEAVRQLWDYLDQAVAARKRTGWTSTCRSAARAAGSWNSSGRCGVPRLWMVRRVPSHVKARLERFVRSER